MRRLGAYWYQGHSKHRIGTLLENPRGPIVYEWDMEFLRYADVPISIELSPLNFRKTDTLVECDPRLFDGLPGLFADCVPDGWGRILLKRGLQKMGVFASDLSPLDALAYIGENGMGALSFEPEMALPSQWAEGQVSLPKLEKGIKPIMEGSTSTVLETFLINGASPNGARPKILLKESKGKFYSGNTPIKADEWLVKFRSPLDPPGIGKLEYIYSKMARKAGLEMPPTRLFTSQNRHYFGVKRFDRSPIGRLHIHTLSGMLHINPGNFSGDYGHYAKVAQLITGDFREIEKVIRLATFNILTCNQDDHAKNMAFLMHPDGTWQVAPAYDLTYHRNTYNQHKLLLNGNGQPKAEDLIKFGISLGLNPREMRLIIEQVKDSAAGFPSSAKKYGLPKTLAKEVATAIDSNISSRVKKG